MIIIAGSVEVDPEQRDAALEAGRPHEEAARAQKGCLDYAWTADGLVPGRIYIFERWESEADLAAHLAGPCYRGQRDTIGKYGPRGGDILKYRMDLAEPVYDSEGRPRADFVSVKGFSEESYNEYLDWKTVDAESRSVVESAIEAMNSGDAQAFADHFADDAKFWMNGSHSFSGPVEGKEAFLELFGRVAAGLDKMITLEVKNLITAGEWVVAETLGDATTLDGSPYCNTYCMVWRVRDGKVIELKEYNDSQLVVEKFPQP